MQRASDSIDDEGAAAALRAWLQGRPARERLVRVASRVTPGQEAEDAAHDAVVQALAAADRFRQHAQVSTWMHRIAVNAALMMRRRSKRLEYVGESIERVAETAPSGEPDPSPEASLAERERLTQLQRAVRNLAQPYREVVERCWLEERSPEEVARELGIRPSGVRTRLVRARRQLAAAAW